MSILGWILVGLIAGALAQWVTHAPSRGCLGTIIVGVLGAVIGGALWGVATGDHSALDNFDLGSIGIAFLGAVVLLLILEALRHSPRR
jgi:uncharacterized membrane protein YeaQ/YmgE (transglycosylase-associated protein family)